ncbi:hypothetical protein BCR42DRAFT_422696 [Absidia repens]|uniref:Uncharacterized protein n=1 Tax=Absidia repens TaxID=90262 RepID=A0A1X2I5Y4_9FUNG|nr:hypothetical protein BCR42DRAFT_422696 [Absidia repens]
MKMCRTGRYLVYIQYAHAIFSFPINALALQFRDPSANLRHSFLTSLPNRIILANKNNDYNTYFTTYAYILLASISL